MTIGNEMGDFEKYEKMLPEEFYEFLGRWAFYVFRDNNSHETLEV
jgi:hypothetical protein